MKMTKKEKLAEIDRILTLKGQKRWRAIADFTVNTNARARKQHEAQLREIEVLRATRANDNGSASISKNLRFGVSVPSTIWDALVGFDTMVDGDSILKNPKKSHTDPMGTNSIVRQLAHTFPEYRVYKNIVPKEEGYGNNS